MSQQYILLRKHNELLNSLIGESFNQKSKFEAEKILDEIHSKAESRMIGKKALCYIVDNLEIKGVGGSTLLKDKNGKIISNLILDQFGLFLSGIFKFKSVAGLGRVLKDFAGVNQTVNVYAGGGFFNNVSLNSLGISLIVGSSSTIPVRTDFSVTLFGTAPESGSFIPITNPVWNSGSGNFKTNGSIIAGGSGTINESGLITVWSDFANVAKSFLLFRDIISPAQAFILGQTIALEYTVQL